MAKGVGGKTFAGANQFARFICRNVAFPLQGLLAPALSSPRQRHAFKVAALATGHPAASLGSKLLISSLGKLGKCPARSHRNTFPAGLRPGQPPLQQLTRSNSHSKEGGQAKAKGTFPACDKNKGLGTLADNFLH